MAREFMNRLAEGPVLCDGAYYLELERRCVGSYASYIPMAALNCPEGLLQLHREYVIAGAEVIQAMAWGVNYDLDQEAELHHATVRLAREAAGKERFVAGTLSPYIYSGVSDWQAMTAQETKKAQAFFERRVGQQLEAGVDLFIVETFYSVEEAALAIPLVHQANVPAVVTLTYTAGEFTREGYSPGEAAGRLQDSGADVVGVNCQRPWDTMHKIAKEIRESVSVPVCTQPNFYALDNSEYFTRCLTIPDLWAAHEPRVVSRYHAALYAQEAQAMGVNLIGGCCGSSPYHIRAMAEALGKPTGMPDRDREYQITRQA
jgi:betaine-homocysteine S-methyltransferase